MTTERRVALLVGSDDDVAFWYPLLRRARELLHDPLVPSRISAENLWRETCRGFWPLVP
jgi:hypothetical protein